MDKRQRWTMVAVVLGSTIIFLDATVVNVALEEIGRDLPRKLFGRLEGQTYIYAAYLLTLSALLIPAGAASDIFGRRTIFTLGLSGFALTSVMCAVSPNMETLIVCRILQGVAGALVVPGSLAILTTEFQDELRGRAFGIWAGSSAAGTIAGPFVGGLLIQWTSWRAAFYLNVPILLLALYATRRHVTESRGDETSSGQMDWRGSIVAVVALGGLVFGVIRGQQGQWRDPMAFFALACGALASILFVAFMARSAHPLIPLELFRSRNFSVTNVSTVLIYGAIYSVQYFFPLYAQGTLGYDAAAAGVASLPSWLFLAAFSSRFGKLAVRHGPRFFMAAGPGLMGFGLLWFTMTPRTSAGWTIDSPGGLVPPADYLVHFFPGWILFGIGLVMMVTPLTTALMTSVPPIHAGIASAVNNAISRVGPQLAGAVIFVAMTATFYGTLAQLRPDLEIERSSFRDAVAPLNEPDGAPASAKISIEIASTKAFHRAIQIAAAMLFLGGLVNAVGIRNEDAAGDLDG